MCFLWSRRAVGQGKAGHWRNTCPGSTRGTVPFCPRKHQQCSTSGFCWQQITRPELTTRAPGVGKSLWEGWKRSGQGQRQGSTLHISTSSTARWTGPLEVKAWMWCPHFHHNSYSFIHQPPLPPLPINLNQAPQSVFSSPITEDWLIIRHFTTHPL